MNNRIATGMPGLDEILLGGFIQDRAYLLVGGAGTGKTILSLQWLISAQKRNEQCLYITIAEAKDDIEINLRTGQKIETGLEVAH
jgi:circadian clock protein KaiC